MKREPELLNSGLVYADSGSVYMEWFELSSVWMESYHAPLTNPAFDTMPHEG